MTNRYTTPWTATDELWLATLWEHGETITAIGRAMGISRNAVVGKAHRMGLAPRRSPLQPSKLTRSDVAQMKKLRRQGETYEAIGRRFGYSDVTARRYTLGLSEVGI